MRMRRRRKISNTPPVNLGPGGNHTAQMRAMNPAGGLHREVALTGLSMARRLAAEPYRVYVATTEEERTAAYRLRFRVFTFELQEGLPSAYSTCEDQDEFDAVCDHVVVEARASAIA